MKKVILILLPLLIITACDNNNPTSSNNENTSWVFVANEGSFGASTGSISMINDFGEVFETEAIGDVVQSLAVYEDKLIVLINNSHKIKIYDITTDGLAMPGIEVSTDGSSPREMVVVDGNVYFTNWNSSDVKVFNLTTYNIDASIPVGAMPEGMLTDGSKIWVANSGSTTISEIDIASNQVIETHEVGQGPQNLVQNGNAIYVSRTFYDENWNAFHGASKIDGEILINNYGSGAVCGGAVISKGTDVFRSFNGGLSKMDTELNLSDDILGNFSQWQVYHVELIDDNFWFAITDFADLNEVHVLDDNGNTLNVYNVGQFPGDFVKWESQ